MTEDDPIYAVVLQALDCSRDDEGVIDLGEAAAYASRVLRPMVYLRPSMTDVSWARLLASVSVEDPYTVITPEERAAFPLSQDMVDQNVRLLEILLDELMSETQLVVPRKERDPSKNRGGGHYRRRGAA
jgi:hypothetical protein